MNKRQKIIVSITGITLVLLILVGLTYAYFLTRIQGNTNTKSISVTTADLKLVYGDGNANIITKEKIQPGEIIGEKDFTVTNEGNSESDYIVVIDDVSITNVTSGDTTTFSSNDFVYTLTCTQKNKNTNEVSGTCDGVSEETSLPLYNNGLLVANKIAENIRQEYVLTVTYKETNENQSADMNKKLEAKVDIKDIKTINPYSNNTDSLAYKIINNAVNISERESIENGTAKLYAKPLTKPAQEIVASIYTKPDLDTLEVEEGTYELTDEIIFGTDYEIDNQGHLRIINSQTGIYSEVYENLPGKYMTDTVDYENGYTDYVAYVVTADTNGNITGKVIYDEVLPPSSSLENILTVTPDNLGTSYYFRGDVKNNYINFNDMCWRIVRIEGDGSVKLLLADKENTCDSPNYNTINTNAFIAQANYYERSYTVADALNTFINGGDFVLKSGLRTTTYTFDGFSSESKSYIKNDNWYIDDTSKRFENTYEDVFSEYIHYYGSYISNRIEKNGQIQLTYNNNITSYNSYAGLLSVDEAILSGLLNYSNIRYYEHFISNSYILENISDDAWFLLGYFGFYENLQSLNPYVISNKRIRDTTPERKYIRPCITLQSGVEVTGDGTQTNPYEIY